MTMKDVIAAWAAGAMAVVVALGGLTVASATSTATSTAGMPSTVRSLESAAYGGADWAMDVWETTGTIPARPAVGDRHAPEDPIDPVEDEAMNSVLAGP